MAHKILTFLKSKGFNLFLFILIVFGYGALAAEYLINHTCYTSYILGGGTIFYLIVLAILKLFDPYHRVLKEIERQELESERVRIFYDKLLPIMKNELPKKLFRYITLGEDGNKNDMRFKTLENNELWLSRADCLNDPFEGYNLYYSEEFPFDADLGESSIKSRKESWAEFTEQARKKFFICSFSQDYRIAPMWAHYTGNHKGFCVEYELVDKSNFYQVQYWASKFDVAFDMERLQKNYFLGELTQEECFKTLKDLHRYWCSIKGVDWKYEREVRAIIDIDDNNICGLNKKIDEVGLAIKGIYIGTNCSEVNKNKLRNIANNLNVFVKQMAPDYNGDWSIMKESELK